MYQWYKKLLPYHGKEKSLAIFNSGVNQQKNNFFGFLYVSATGEYSLMIPIDEEYNLYTQW